MGKVAIYVRVSTSDGKQDYTRQISDLKKIAYRDGYKDEDIKEFKDTISGYTKKDDRPALSQMLDDINSDNKIYENIYITEVSRLGRNPSHVRQIMDELTNLGIPIYVQTMNQYTIENGNRNSIMNIVLQVLMEFSHSEAEQMKSRCKSGLLQAAKDGRVGGGKMYAYGYKNENQQLVVDDVEAEIIKQIFALYKQGNGSKFISNYLNNNHVPTRLNKVLEGKKLKITKTCHKDASTIKWSDTQILSVLKNTIYKGERNFKGDVIKIQGIVSKELFDECTKIREKKTHRNYQTIYDYLLKDILVCGCCGRNYFAKYKPVPSGDKVYICSSRLLKGGNCGNVGVNISYLESVIYDLLITSEALSKHIKNKDTMILSIGSEVFKLKQETTTYTNELNLKNEALTRTTKLYINMGAMSENDYINTRNEILSEINSLKEKIDSLSFQIIDLEKMIVKLKSADSSKSFFKKLKNDRKQIIQIFKEYINKIILTKIDNHHVVANVFLSINGKLISESLKVLMDMRIPARKKNLIFNYGFGGDLGFQFEFENNILLTDKKMILDKFNQGKETGIYNQIITKEKHLITYHDVPEQNVFKL